ncbi:hypothetical protein F7Q99_19960 [Streptomyces kaniharaensis]|uniref:Uncharacterized protein n=1 Tax=Streptomyces kaniharaensis TaxID=212423 RepID=A0A6N7KS94_9ACTN|nr:hypothetical protein [Streptomyces kaniharaensis]MQS14476.1 hypothetical protein [Streptomyces kaniharaensis]
MSERLSIEALDGFRAVYKGQESEEARTIMRLVAEVEVLDRLLTESEDEVEYWRAEAERLRAKVEPKALSASISPTASGKWAVRWREDGSQRSRTFERRAHAEQFRAEMRGRWTGGAR